MGAQVDELVEQIRIQADAHVTQQNRGTQQSDGSAAAELDRGRANLAIAQRAQDRLPPVTSYRHGLIARFELWIKRGLKRATRWFTWEQTNFNAATAASLQNILNILANFDKAVSDIRAEIADDGALSKPDVGHIPLESRLAAIEAKLQALLTEMQNRDQRHLDLLREEQRACFKQLATQISEVAVVSDRAKRNLQMRLDELVQRIDNRENQQEKSRQF